MRRTNNIIWGILLIAVSMVLLLNAFEIASIPLLVIGYRRMHTSTDVYNVACATAQAQPFWTIQASEQGFGLALNF